jgi:hypothetical protein
MFTEHSVEAKGRFAPFGYIYLLRWPGDLVKIGSTKDPYERLHRHAAQCPNEVWLLGPLLKFATPALAAAVEKHLQLALEDRSVAEEIFAWPELARSDPGALQEFEALARWLFQEQLGLQTRVPKEGRWQLSSEAWSDYFVKAAESPAYWEASRPISPARKVRNPAMIAKRSAALKAARANPKVRQRAAANMAARWADPEYKARVTAAIRDASARPEVRAKLSSAATANWQDPSYRAKISASLGWSRTPEVRAKRSQDARAQWKDPEVRARRIAELKAAATRRTVPTSRKFNDPAEGSLF